MRRDRGEECCSARYAVLERIPPPVVWVEFVEAPRDVSNSVLLETLGKFVLEFFFLSVGPSSPTGLDSGPGPSPGALCLILVLLRLPGIGLPVLPAHLIAVFG